MTENRLDQTLMNDALTVFQAWLCGEGVTSPGVFADNDVLAEELRRLEVLKRRTEDALALFERSDRIREALRHSLPEDTDIGPAQEVAPLSACDIRRIKSALEVCAEEYSSLNFLIGASPCRVVVSTSADPSQDALVVIDLPKR